MDYDRTRPLADGRVRAEGVDLTFLPMGMPESFFRMSKHGEFDISEMSLSWYARICLDDHPSLIAIPVFPSRMFRHGAIYVNSSSGIREPADLVGKRVGCPEYQMTAAVWIKGIMADHHGVPVASVEYYTGGLEQPGRRERPFEPSDGIVVKPIGSDRTLNEMLVSGEIDALYTAQTPSSYLDGDPRVGRLFEDYPEVEREYFRETGFFPIMHTIVIRKALDDRHPWLAQSLTKAFEEAKEIALSELETTVALRVMLPWLLRDLGKTREAMGEDYWPYGLERNRDQLATFLRYSHEQGLTGRRLEPEELFAPQTLETSKI